MILEHRRQARSKSIGLAAVLAAYVLCLAPALSQELLGKTSAPEPAKTKETRIFKLKNASVADIATILTKALGGASAGSLVSIQPEPITNQLLVIGPKAEIEKVQAILEQLDQPGASSGPPAGRLKVHHLGSIEPTGSVVSALQMLVNPRAGNFAVDEQRRVAIVSADDVAHKAVEDLFRSLQALAIPRGPVVDVKVRVLWLVNGQKGEQAAPLPDDLKEVLAGLAKLGIDRPRLAAQTLVNGTVGTQFQAQGVAKLDNATCRLTVSGRLSVKGDTPALEISLNASQPGGRGSGETSLCDLRTEITAPVGHFVVLGMTPMDAMTSVFVVQVLKPEPRDQRP